MVTQANQAIMLLQQGLVEEAAALADRLIAAHPDDVRVHIVRGRIAYVAGDTSTAVRHFEEAFEREDSARGAALVTASLPPLETTPAAGPDNRATVALEPSPSVVGGEREVGVRWSY